MHQKYPTYIPTQTDRRRRDIYIYRDSDRKIHMMKRDEMDRNIRKTARYLGVPVSSLDNG